MGFVLSKLQLIFKPFSLVALLLLVEVLLPPLLWVLAGLL